MSIINFREGKNFIVPYIELDFHGSTGLTGPIDIKEVIVSPNPNEKLALVLVEFFK